MEFTHGNLVGVAYRWVLKNASCGVAFKEFSTSAPTGEIPDVIGFGAWRHSVVVEVKVSRSDFFNDRKKPFRKAPELGMGVQRYYCCPTGLIKVEELPEMWGLIYVNDKGKAICVHNPYKYVPNEERGGLKRLCMVANLEAERAILYSALRRLHLRGRIDDVYIGLAESKKLDPFGNG